MQWRNKLIYILDGLLEGENMFSKSKLKTARFVNKVSLCSSSEKHDAPATQIQRVQGSANRQAVITKSWHLKNIMISNAKILFVLTNI